MGGDLRGEEERVKDIRLTNGGAEKTGGVTKVKEKECCC